MLIQCLSNHSARRINISAYFNDSNSVLIFVVGVLVVTIFIIGVWELMREGMTGMQGALSMKIKNTPSNESN